MHWVTTASMTAVQVLGVLAFVGALAGVASPSLVGMKSRWESVKAAFGVVVATPLVAIFVGFVLGLVFGFPPTATTAQPTDAAPTPVVVAQAPPAPVKSAPSKKERNPPVTGDAALVTVTMPACHSQEVLKDVLQMLRAGDRAAFEKAMIRRGLAGECIVLSAGEPVFVSELAIWQGLARVRRKGEPDAFWVDHGFVEKVP